MSNSIPLQLWSIPISLSQVQPPLSEDAIRTATQMVQHPLPPLYLELLKQQNGGMIRYRHPEVWGHKQIFGLGNNFPSLGYLLLDPEEEEELSFSVDELFRFDGDGHWALCLDYRSGSDIPAVTYVDVEDDYENVVADSFEKYLEGLVLDTEDRYVLTTSADLASSIQELESLLETPFKDQGTQHHGYPIFCAQWENMVLRITANLVPKGFLGRKKRSPYRHLKALVEGDACQFPEVASDALILNLPMAKNWENLQLKIRELGWELLPMKEAIENP